MPSPSGHRDSLPYTNGHISPLPVHVAPTQSPSDHSDSDLSDTNEPAAAAPSSDVDAPGEEYDDDDNEPAAADSDSSDDVDAEGEPDGDYDSDSPPSEHAPSSPAQSVSSQESSRPLKRKASADKDDYMTQNPELYGLRRSVRVINSPCEIPANRPPGSCPPYSSHRR